MPLADALNKLKNPKLSTLSGSCGFDASRDQKGGWYELEPEQKENTHQFLFLPPGAKEEIIREIKEAVKSENDLASALELLVKSDYAQYTSKPDQTYVQADDVEVVLPCTTDGSTREVNFEGLKDKCPRPENSAAVFNEDIKKIRAAIVEVLINNDIAVGEEKRSTTVDTADDVALKVLSAKRGFLTKDNLFRRLILADFKHLLPVIIKWIAKFPARLALLSDTDANGDTILHLAADDEIAFISLAAAFAQHNIFPLPNQKDETVLHKILAGNHSVASLQNMMTALDTLPGGLKAIVSKGSNILAYILSGPSKNEEKRDRIALLREKLGDSVMADLALQQDASDRNALHLAIVAGGDKSGLLIDIVNQILLAGQQEKDKNNETSENDKDKDEKEGVPARSYIEKANLVVDKVSDPWGLPKAMPLHRAIQASNAEKVAMIFKPLSPEFKKELALREVEVDSFMMRGDHLRSALHFACWTLDVAGWSRNRLAVAAAGSWDGLLKPFWPVVLPIMEVLGAEAVCQICFNTNVSINDRFYQIPNDKWPIIEIRLGEYEDDPGVKFANERYKNLRQFIDLFGKLAQGFSLREKVSRFLMVAFFYFVERGKTKDEHYGRREKHFKGIIRYFLGIDAVKPEAFSDGKLFAKSHEYRDIANKILGDNKLKIQDDGVSEFVKNFMKFLIKQESSGNENYRRAAADILRGLPAEHRNRYAESVVEGGLPSEDAGLEEEKQANQDSRKTDVSDAQSPDDLSILLKEQAALREEFARLSDRMIELNNRMTELNTRFDEVIKLKQGNTGMPQVLLSQLPTVKLVVSSSSANNSANNNESEEPSGTPSAPDALATAPRV